MGYSTAFEGRFTFDQEPPIAILNRLQALADADTRDLKDGVNYPSSYCQWEPHNADGWGLKWDGNEKFYGYIEWLQWLIDNVLKPVGLTIRGRVKWQGDDISDRGVIIIEDDQHVRTENMPVVSDELQDLKNFRDWVLGHRDFGDEVRDAWLEYNE